MIGAGAVVTRDVPDFEPIYTTTGAESVGRFVATHYALSEPLACRLNPDSTTFVHFYDDDPERPFTLWQDVMVDAAVLARRGVQSPRVHDVAAVRAHRAASIVRVIGFSYQTSFPALAASMLMIPCQWGGVAICTMSIPGSASNSR